MPRDAPVTMATFPPRLSSIGVTLRSRQWQPERHLTALPRIASPARRAPICASTGAIPVDWYTWGEEAFARARELDRPLFVSIGYSACHWCHVMGHESFADPITAQEMNDPVVAIKVDREERPDVDAVYMEAVQAASGHGGWPMSVFALPDGRPFFAGTYFPNRPGRGMPEFRAVLAAVADAWTTRREDVVHQAEALSEAVAARLAPPPPLVDLGRHPEPRRPRAAGGAASRRRSRPTCRCRPLSKLPRRRCRRDVRPPPWWFRAGTEVPSAPAPRPPSPGSRRGHRRAPRPVPTPGRRVHSRSDGRWGDLGSLGGGFSRYSVDGSGSSPTSRRCSTTRPSSPASTSTPGS